MQASTMRLLWSIVAEVSPNTVGDSDMLIENLVRQVSDRGILSDDEQNDLESYLRSKKNLLLEVIAG